MDTRRDSGRLALCRGLAFIWGVLLVGPSLMLLVALPLAERLLGDGSDPWWPAVRWIRYASLLPQGAERLAARLLPDG